MAVLSLTEIPKLKEQLLPLGYTIHIHDACGGQSFTLEKLSEKNDDSIFQIIEDFFKEHRMNVEFFGKDNLNFIAK